METGCRRRYIGQQPGTKNAFGHADKPLVRKPGKLLVNRGFCSSIGLHRSSFVRTSGETSRRVVFDVLEGKKNGYLMGESTARRPVFPPPRPASLGRPAVRRPAPTHLWYVRVLKSTDNLRNYHGARKCEFGAKPGPKRTSCSGRTQQGFVREAITYSVIITSSCIVFLGGRLRVS